MNKVYLRIDDIGASTKHFEVYSKNRLGNILFLKYTNYFKAWGPYEELLPLQWEKIFELLIKYNAKLTVGITASWVEKNGTLIPFPEKFSAQADLLKSALNSGIIEIANHGLTHCVVGNHLPKLFTSNRKYHREFWDWIPEETHYKHLETSQKIFFDWLGQSPQVLIPPGNVYSIFTLKAAEKFGIKKINSYINHDIDSNVEIINDSSIDAFHDREIVLDGIPYFEKKIKHYYGKYKFCKLKDFDGI